MQTRNNVRRRRQERIQQLLREQASEEAAAPEPIFSARPAAPAPVSAPEAEPVRSKPETSSAERDPELWWKERQRRQNHEAGGWPNLTGLSPAAHAPDGKYAPPDKFNAPRFARGFALRLTIAAILFAAVWGMLRLELPGSDGVRNWMVTTVTRDMDFEAIEAWYGETFGGAPSFLPFDRNRPETKEVSALFDPGEVVFPVKGRLVQSFAQSGNGVKIAAPGGSDVAAIHAGRVQQVETGSSGEITILVQHQNRILSVYGNLASSNVKVNEWVETGDKLGRLHGDSDAGEQLLYFAVQQNDKKINPAEVVPFD